MFKERKKNKTVLTLMRTQRFKHFFFTKATPNHKFTLLEIKLEDFLIPQIPFFLTGMSRKENSTVWITLKAAIPLKK